MAPAALPIELPQGLSRLVLCNVGHVAERYGKRVPEVYEALRDGRLSGHKAGKWNWIIFQHELPETWPEPPEAA